MAWIPELLRQRRVVHSSAALGIVIAVVLSGGTPALARSRVRAAFSTVRAVNVDGGRIALPSGLGRPRRYRLHVPVGAYLVVFSTIYANGGTSQPRRRSGGGQAERRRNASPGSPLRQPGGDDRESDADAHSRCIGTDPTGRRVWC